MTATFIALYTITAAMTSYVVFWTWWHETSPEIEAQRLARIAISTIIYGNVDSTAGTYNIGSTTYTRHNGIAQATRMSALSTLPSQAMTFGLEPDTSNCRSYYLGFDASSGTNAVYYKDSNNAITKINSTKGIKDLTFAYFTDAGGTLHTNIITVTATVDWNVLVGGSAPHRIYVQYSQLVYLKNVT